MAKKRTRKQKIKTKKPILKLSGDFKQELETNSESKISQLLVSTPDQIKADFIKTLVITFVVLVILFGIFVWLKM